MPPKVTEIPAAFPALEIAMKTADFMMAEHAERLGSQPDRLLEDFAPALGWLARTLACEPGLRRDINRRRNLIIWPELIPGTAIGNLAPAMIVVARGIPATVRSAWDGAGGQTRLEAKPNSTVKDLLKQIGLRD